MKDLINEDWEMESQKDFIYLHEEANEFYNSLTDPGASEINEFLDQPPAKIEVINLTKKKKPLTIVVIGDERLITNNEPEANTLPF